MRPMEATVSRAAALRRIGTLEKHGPGPRKRREHGVSVLRQSRACAWTWGGGGGVASCAFSRSGTPHLHSLSDFAVTARTRPYAAELLVIRRGRQARACRTASRTGRGTSARAPTAREESPTVSSCAFQPLALPPPPIAVRHRCVCTTGTVRHKAEVKSKSQRGKLFSDMSWAPFAAVERQREEVRSGSTAPK